MLKEYLRLNYVDNFLHLRDDSVAPATLPTMTLLQSGHNDGYARGNNKGLRIAEGDESITHILILNNDILFVDDIIPRLLHHLNAIKDCAIISPVLYKRNMEGLDYNCARREVTVNDLIKKNLFHYVYRLLNKRTSENRFLLRDDRMQPKENIMHIDLPSGSCMLIEKTFFQSIGYFDPNTFLYYEEDILYAKIKKQQKSNYLDLDTKCIHLGALSTQLTSSKFLVYTNFRSELYFVEKYLDCNTIYKIIHGFSVRIGWRLFLLQKKINSY